MKDKILSLIDEMGVIISNPSELEYEELPESVDVYE